MTTEYQAGTEDIGVVVEAGADGMARLGIYDMKSGVLLIRVALPGEAARLVAFKLTTASYKSEDLLRESDDADG